jgi:hypothetical protein
MKKTYCIENLATWTECSVEVDLDFVLPFKNDDKITTTADAIKDMVEFWIGWENRLEANQGDYTITFLQQLAREINYIQIEYNYNLIGVIDEFRNRNGWCAMDGSFGIWIKQIDDFELPTTDYHVLDEGSIAEEAAAV